MRGFVRFLDEIKPALELKVLTDDADMEDFMGFEWYVTRV